MIRYFLAKGDRGGSAVITEGLEGVTCSNPPPCVQIATLYMKTYCTACKREGFIAPKGPRRPGTGPNGKQWALSGDINICDCSPPPVFYAERGMTMSFTSQEAAALVIREANPATAQAGAAQHDEQFTLVDAKGTPLTSTYYTVRMPSGELRHSVTDSQGRTERYQTKGAQSIRIYLGHKREI
ncbi:PAAR domain-containing protein [Paraburkholderia gardini]|uniref:hypothetical protein n=1 Tax=Paraburkholderia gardini TaxID=2823469 RepID=UPI001D8C557C|nr:hypothetical protein [Paraburkholderia gardini]CAG4913201.1 hypothetical protein R69919_04070 [Paraburkholderia gardini]